MVFYNVNNMALKYFIFIVCVYYLAKDFKRSPKKHALAKFTHFIVTTLIILVYFDTIPSLFKLLFKYDQIISEWNNNLSSLESIFNYINNIAYILCGILMLFYGIGFLYRSEAVRKVFVNYILIFIPITILNVYFISIKMNTGDNIYYILIGSIFSIIIFGLISFLYKQSYMINFFNGKND